MCLHRLVLISSFWWIERGGTWPEVKWSLITCNFRRHTSDDGLWSDVHKLQFTRSIDACFSFLSILNHRPMLIPPWDVFWGWKTTRKSRLHQITFHRTPCDDRIQRLWIEELWLMLDMNISLCYETWKTWSSPDGVAERGLGLESNADRSRRKGLSWQSNSFCILSFHFGSLFVSSFSVSLSLIPTDMRKRRERREKRAKEQLFYVCTDSYRREEYIRNHCSSHSVWHNALLPIPFERFPFTCSILYCILSKLPSGKTYQQLKVNST